MQVGFAGSVLLGFAINFASFWCLSVTSGTTYSFVGASNKIPAVVLGHFLFSSSLTKVGWVGVVSGLTAGLGYAWSKHQLDNMDLKRVAARALLRDDAHDV